MKENKINLMVEYLNSCIGRKDHFYNQFVHLTEEYIDHMIESYTASNPTALKALKIKFGLSKRKLLLLL